MLTCKRPVVFVGYWPAQDSIIVAHEGTNPFQFLSLLVDAEFSHEPLDPTLFPDVPSSVLVHAGFGNAHKATAISILAEVKRLIAQTSSKNVVTIGHSLGGALAELDALFLTLNLPSTIKVKGVTYGTPRVGNAPFAQLLDFKVDLYPIPIVPPPFLNYHHPSGEIHIDAHNNAVSCPGADNTADSECSNQVVRNVAQGNILDHLGPYAGIYVGIQSCIL
ncbi:uncharacterized protein LACBIDRAFT_296286 [Laccaria bicolor S238N-H82]|uniref:Predicted protein n=1 Tax=Laccaria bicolor (strain S238N-H82 / ATCC MYA-4686) TaxID=486041 RepID=B0D8F1_LACBS|nr:uncharacterized protein LACBIDRAFT_296286 [Laccaria bicolor S238N-H82]EDR08826.1 predicted protein [Laccaria bicolor S238N-H82]|eukprot:XP_001880139.1 predicted protein [Laccaria bicolor S238N-H82]